MGAKYILKPTPPIGDDATQHYYAALVNPHTVSFEELAAYVSKHSKLYNATTVKAVVSELETYLAELLANGHHVQLGTIGKLWLTLEGPIVESKSEIHGKQLTFGAVKFQANKQFVQQCRRGNIEQYNHDTGITSAASPEQRKNLLTNYLEENPFITCAIYQQLTGLRRTTALKELHQLAANGLLKTEGTGTRIVFVKG